MKRPPGSISTEAERSSLKSIVTFGCTLEMDSFVATRRARLGIEVTAISMRGSAGIPKSFTEHDARHLSPSVEARQIRQVPLTGHPREVAAQ